MASPEVVIIGAGPAGSMAGFLLARAGVDVLLTDRAAFPRRKLCGGCLAQSGCDLLSANQLHTLPSLRAANALARLRLRSCSRVLDLRVPPYRVIDRAGFDRDMVNAAVDAGARFSPETQARVYADHTLGLAGPRAGQRTLSPRVILVADGIKGSSLRGLDRFAWHAERGAYIGMGAIADALPDGCDPDAVNMYHFASGYAGIAPLGDGRAVIGAAVDPGWVKGRHESRPLVGLLKELGIGVEHCDSWLPTGGAPGLTRRRASVEADGRIFLIGDATGYIEPFTGEGMTWALGDACMVTDHALAVLGGRYTPGDWDAQHRHINTRRKILCRSTARLLRMPRLTHALIGAASRSPSLSGGLVRVVRVLQRRNIPQKSIA